MVVWIWQHNTQYPLQQVPVMPALLLGTSCYIAGIFRLLSSSSCLLLPSSVATPEAAVFCGSKVMCCHLCTENKAHHFIYQPGQQQHDFLLAQAVKLRLLLCQTHSYQEWNLLLATVVIHRQAMHNMAMVESECVTQRKLLRGMAWLLWSAACSVLCLVLRSDW